MAKTYKGAKVLYVLTEADVEVVYNEGIEEGIFSGPEWADLSEECRDHVFLRVRRSVETCFSGVWYDAIRDGLDS